MTLRGTAEHAMRLMLCVAAALLLTALPARAQEQDGGRGLEGLKIGVVHLNRALNQSAAGERSKQVLRAARDQMEANLKAKERELKSLREELEQNMMLTEEARSQRQQQLRQREQELRQEVQQAQNELQDRERKLTESIFVELRTIIERIGEERNFDLVLEQNAAQVVLFSTAPLRDITDEVIERYDATYGGSGSEQPAGGSGSTN